MTASHRLTCVAFILGYALAAVPSSSRAAGPYDPEVPYLTLQTPNFYVMYPAEYGHIALRAAHMAEEARPYLIQRYQWEPAGRISIVINDQTDFANGSATILPSKIVTIFVTAPTKVSGLEDYDDWLSTVLIHELAHIFHLDMAYGLPWIGRLFFGKYVSMNLYTPGWVTEGLAVYEETVSGGAGRGRSTYVDMVMRAAALEGEFPPIDQGYRGYPNWPYSNVAYFFGGRFQLWLAERYGEDKLLEYHRIYAANPIPFFTYLPAKMVFDASIEALWDTFEAEATAKAELERELMLAAPLPVTEPKRLTFHGGESVGPRITPDGKRVVWSTNSPVDGPRVRRMNLEDGTEEVLLEDTLSQAISFSPKGDAFYFQQTEINQRFYTHNSIYRYDVEREAFDVITLDDFTPDGFIAPSGSLRVRDPDISPQGDRIVMVQAPYGANRLVLAWLEEDGVTIHPKVIVRAEPDVQLATPRFSPDGQHIAVARFKGGRRDIVVYDLNGKLVKEVTRDRAQDTDPTWSADGRWLVFSSDRTGIYNLYAHDFNSGELRQLTNVITGVFQPSVAPDGSSVVFRGYSAEGFDVYQVPFQPEQGLSVSIELDPPEVVDTRVRAWPPTNAGAPSIPAPAPFKDTPFPQTLPEGWSVHGYSALDTILPFNDNWNLFPSLQANEREIYGSLTHFGSDARYTHSYLLNVRYGSLTRFLGGAAAYSFDVLEPSFTFFASADAVTYGNALLVESDPNRACPFADAPLDLQDGRRICFGSKDGFYNERQLRAQMTIGLPVLQRHFFSISYIFENRAALDDLPANTITRVLPAAGDYARVQLGYTYANVRAFPYSISLERGPSFGASLSAFSKGLGGDFEQLQITTEGRYYLDLPWTASGFTNHVLATRLAVGFGLGPDVVRTFRLGGVEGDSALTTSTENFYGLRGFATSSLRGTAVISGSTEYRAPLFRVDRGIGTLPFTLRVVHAALFADYGRVFPEIDFGTIGDGFFDEMALGAGAELRADVILFYSLPLSLRLGYAFPFVTPASLDAGFRAPGLYFQLGAAY